MKEGFTRAHGPFCREPYTGECKQFSTDGTRLGTDIAHQFGTTDEREIAHTDSIGTMAYHQRHSMTGMSAEQREWEGYDDAAEADEEDDGGDF